MKWSVPPVFLTFSTRFVQVLPWNMRPLAIDSLTSAAPWWNTLPQPIAL